MAKSEETECSQFLGLYVLAGERSRRVRDRSFQVPCDLGLRPRPWDSASRQGSLPCFVVLSEVTLLFHHRRNCFVSCESVTDGRDTRLSPSLLSNTHPQTRQVGLPVAASRTFRGGGRPAPHILQNL